jgi:hypothetical protein
MKMTALLYSLLKQIQQLRGDDRGTNSAVTLRKSRVLARDRLEGWKQARCCVHPSRRERDFVALALRMTVEFVARSQK